MLAWCSLDGMPSAHAATIVGSWQMNEAPGSVHMIDATFPANNSDPFHGAVLNGSKYAFPGWTANVGFDGRLTGDLADSTVGEIRVVDPAGDLVPAAGTFAIKVKFKPTLLNGQLPLPGTSSELLLPSYNIVQRGRANDIGGFYKLELMGFGSKLGRVHCAMKAPGFSALDVYSAPVVDGLSHKVECVIDRTAKALRIMTDGVVSESKSFVVYGSIEPRDIYGTYFTVGKKPGSDNPADAFAGQIDYVTISR